MLREVVYRTSRSSGPGGQHVNKTESKVELLWKPAESACLDAAMKERLLSRLARRITDEGYLQLSSQKHRSQLKNREEVQQRFLRLVKAGLTEPKKRQITRPTRVSIEKRLEQKRRKSEIKQSRRKDLKP